MSSSVSIDVYAGSVFSSSISARISFGMMLEISECTLNPDPLDMLMYCVHLPGQRVVKLSPHHSGLL